MTKKHNLSESDIAKRRDDALRRALKTPPKAQGEYKGRSLTDRHATGAKRVPDKK